MKAVIVTYLLVSSVILKAQDIQEVQTNQEVEEVAEEIQDLHYIQKSQFYYSNQSRLWKNRIKSDSLNPVSWYNYYKATRYSVTDATTGRCSNFMKRKLDGIVQKMAVKVPKSYQYNYIRFWNGNFDLKNEEYLNKAYSLFKNSNELLDDRLIVSLLKKDELSFKKGCIEWQQKSMSDKRVLRYNRNVLKSLESKAILFTNAYNDTYPAWVLQQQEKLRTDVEIVYIPLLVNKTYRSLVESRTGLNLKGFQQSQLSYWVAEVIKYSSNRPVYVALTCDKTLMRQLGSKLYVTGLAMKYSKTSIDNMVVLNYNWDNIIDHAFLKNIKSGSIESKYAHKRIESNYLIPMLQLYDYYVSNSLTKKAKTIQTVIKKITARTKYESDVDRYLSSR